LSRLARFDHLQRDQHLDPEEEERDAVLCDQHEQPIAGNEARHVLGGRTEKQQSMP
jgi:hypothetical protein